MDMFPHTITVMNKVESDDGAVYLPSTIKGVLYVSFKTSAKDVTGVSGNNTIKCTIPMSITSQKPYLSKREYDALPATDKPDYFTLAPDDVIVKGVISSVENSLNAINNLCEERFVIKNIDVLDYGMLSHWQVGGS